MKTKLVVKPVVKGMKKVRGALGPMEADDRCVKLPEFVEVIDAKHGNFIGWLKRDEVFERIQATSCYRLNEEPLFVLYNFEWGNRTMEMDCNSLWSYLQTARQHIETAVPCDDPKLMKLGFSYESGGTKFVMYFPVTKARMEAKMMNRTIRAAIDRLTPGILAMFKRELAASSRKPSNAK